MAENTNHHQESGTAIGTIQGFVTSAQLIKTVLGMLVGSVVACLAVYQHFAKTSELKELACKVVEQNRINNEMLTTSREIKGALKVLKDGFDKTKGKISTEHIASEISDAITRIDASLDRVTKTREAAQEGDIKKETKC